MAWENRDYYREGPGGVPPVQFSFPKLSPLMMALLGANLLLFLLRAFTRGEGDPLAWHGALTLIEGAAIKQPWRWITYQYLHNDAVHFLFNMIGLFFFLPPLEGIWGWRKALGFYTLGGIVAGAVFAIVAMVTRTGALLVGASGSVLALLGACALLFPNQQLILLVFPVPIRVAAALLGLLYFLTTITGGNFGDAAHLGGLAFGFFAPYLGGPLVAQQSRRLGQWQRARSRRRSEDEQAEIDRILRKVHESGMNSLTRAERNVLARATERQRQQELARAQRAR